LILSCRLYIEEYPDISTVLEDVKGVTVSLPKGLEKAVQNAQIFSGLDVDDNYVVIDLHPGKVTVTGQCVHGWYRKTTKIDYKKKQSINFTITPKILTEILNKYNECVLSKTQLKAGIGSDFTYVTVLGTRPDEKKEE